MHFLDLVPLVAVLAFGCSAAEHEIRGRIFNGVAARRGQFKSMAYIVPKKYSCCGFYSQTFICGGTLIWPTWVLTAAHCVDEIYKVQVYLGGDRTNNFEVGYEVTRNSIVMHPDWDYVNIFNDLAMVQIPRTAECDSIAYARLPFPWIDRPRSMLADKIGIAPGWGSVGNTATSSDTLRWTKMPLMSYSACSNEIDYITPYQICGDTRRPFGSICFGDSGGPLLLEETGEIVGVSSFIPGSNCEIERPAIFAYVTDYMQWIFEVMEVEMP